MKIRKMYAVPVMALALGIAAQPALAEKSDWFIHGRAIQIVPDESPNSFDISDEWAPDLSIGYFLSDHVALDLLLSIPTKHDIEIDGAYAGSFKQIPPTLFAQYHINPNGTWRPYFGVGINYTAISDEKLGGARLSDSLGLAAQAGMDIGLGKNWSLSFDVKKLWIDTTAKLNGATVASVDVDPWVFGVGFGYRFGKAAPPPPPAAAPPPPPPPKDSDGDGVFDDKDRCPNTTPGVKVDAIGCFVEVTLKLSFDFDSAKLTADDMKQLDGALANLKNFPADVIASIKVHVAGHTDSRGRDAYNQALSERRAASVKDYLVAGGFPEAQIDTIGYGETQPVADNATDEGRAENRRVVIPATR